MYTVQNFKTKKQLKEALKANKIIEVYQPGGFFPSQKDGEVSLEGPHYPEAHKWYARVRIKDGFIVKVIS